MKRWLTISTCLLLVLASTAAATDRAGHFSLGVRGGGFAPMLDGSNFTLNGRPFEPFMMGGVAGIDLSYAISNQFELMAMGSYARTFDDTSGTGDRTFSPAKRDNAITRLNSIQLGLLGRYLFAPASKTQPYLTAGVGFDMTDYVDRSTENAMPKVKDFALKGGIGLTHAFSEVIALDVRALFTYYLSTASTDTTDGSTYSVADWEKYDDRPYKAYIQPTIGLTFSFGGAKDEDKDGVSDKKDECPMTPMGAVVDERGCPMDSDGDGVFDGLDQCAATPKGAKVDGMGCPKDSDGDGVFDGLDACDGTPAGVKVDAKGCPLDGDKDGVPDYMDKQLDTPAGAKVDQDGVGIDSDGDGVYDGIDTCPGTPKDLEVDATGCPVKVAKLVGKITLNIKYASGSAEPDQAAMHVLDSVVEIMRAYPDTRITVTGFTDSQGPEDKNLTLSQKRADGVEAYLISKGVDAERMLTQGKGEDPAFFVGDNKTAEGRQQNRRVEIESAK
jgi:OOP family OmpA-OmpF porin